RVERTPDDVGLLALDQLGDGVHRLGRVALRVAHDQLDLAAVDAARIVDLRHRELGAAVDADTGRRAWSGQCRQVADLDRFVGGNGGTGQSRGKRHSAGGGAGQDLATLDRHDVPPTTPLSYGSA